MIGQILKRPQAERDIEEAFVYLGERDEDAGLDFLFAVEETLELIAANLYFVRENAIELIRLIHSSLDYNRVFDEED